MFGTFPADLWDNAATCITRGVKGQCFMSPYWVTGNRAAGSLFWTSPDRRACTNGWRDEGCDGEQASVWVWVDGLHQVHTCTTFLFELSNCTNKDYLGVINLFIFTVNVIVSGKGGP